ncbi:MAG: succinate dehydrogenase/fumarate reductase iron-sulfur subunit [Deltaproteobacteria bacterium]|nr:succinate dehydrogenase/fumarate reductase iron-sulfur subunit [Deltaproteobacteria bacterium]
MKIKVKVSRCDPMGRGVCEPYLQAYDVKVWLRMTVLEVLTKIKDEQDGSLTFRRSCRSAICGSCAMKINGHPKLACKTRVIPEYERHGSFTIEPLDNFSVIKDLVVDFDVFWEKVAKIEPWLTPKETGKGWWIVKKEDMSRVEDAGNCIFCGCCNGACNSLEADPNFLGPVVLAKAWRFVGDKRDGNSIKRLTRLSEEHGIWICSRCIECTQVCPKDVKPLTAIERLRAQAIKAGITDNRGVRHVDAMVDSVRRTGRLDEFTMTFKTLGVMRSIGMLPLGIRMELHGKMPLPVLFKAIEGIEEVKRIYEEIERQVMGDG